MRRHAEQINGREGDRATLFWRCPLNFSGLAGGFALRHLSRWTAFVEIIILVFEVK